MMFSFLVGSQDAFKEALAPDQARAGILTPEPQTESCQGQHAPKQPSSSQGALS